MTKDNFSLERQEKHFTNYALRPTPAGEIAIVLRSRQNLANQNMKRRLCPVRFLLLLFCLVWYLLHFFQDRVQTEPFD
jgi:hypothetical protein